MNNPHIVTCAGYRRADGTAVHCGKAKLKEGSKLGRCLVRPHPNPKVWHLTSSGICPKCWKRQCEELEIQMSSVSS